MRAINLDMDGTIADLYGVQDWLSYLIAKDTTPYRVAKPLVNLNVLARRLNTLQKKGYEINIISWLSKTSDKEFDVAVTKTKIAWLRKHLPSVKWNNINIVPYGTPKSTCGSDILFDDEENNRKEWKGTAYDVNNILDELKKLI
jgi:5'(3')-deoxyribonucleotidase